MADGALAWAYARRLLADIGVTDYAPLPDLDEPPADVWWRSGMQALTGEVEQPGQMCPLPLASCADGALAALQAISCVSLNGLQGSALLSERAGLMGLQRSGRVCPGGSCRLLDTVDGRLAVNLPRSEDWAMLAAWLENDDAVEQGDWAKLGRHVATRATHELVSRGALMGLAIGAEQGLHAPDSWFVTQRFGEAVQRDRPPVILDMSALWAGPLCTHLLHKLGARVIKLESVWRQDGARDGNEAFFDLLNADKQCISLDLTTESGRKAFHKLVKHVDIIVESARPRGLQQLGIVCEELLAANPGLVWLAITAYGREGEQAHRVGFGDDVAVAAGLSSIMTEVAGRPMFVGDAVADPLTGMHAALAAMAAYQQGGGTLVSLCLHDVTAFCAGFDLPASTQELRLRHHEWSMQVDAESATIPVPRKPAGRARALGVDTQAIFSEFSLS